MRTSDPTVSIVMACRNMEAYIVDALESINAQTFQNYFELIIIDNASTDQTVDVIIDYLLAHPALDDRTMYYCNPVDIGGRESKNLGLTWATGRYTLMVDADDTIEPTMLEEYIPWLESGEYDIVTCNHRWFGEKSGVVVSYHLPFTRNAFWNDNHVHACSMVRRSLYSEIGKLDTSQLFEDWEWWARACIHGARLKRLDRVLFNYRHRPGQVSKGINYEEGRRLVREAIIRREAEKSALA